MMVNLCKKQHKMKDKYVGHKITYLENSKLFMDSFNFINNFNLQIYKTIHQ